MERKKLLIGRVCYGLGDWIMFSSILKSINEQRPDVDIDLYFNDGAAPDFLSMPALFGVRLAIVESWTPLAYDWSVRHLVYPSPRPVADLHLMDAMALVLNDQCPGLNLIIPIVAACPMVSGERIIPWNNYIVLPSSGVYPDSNNHPSRGKDWSHFNELASRLNQAGHTVVQVGNTGDPPLAAARYVRLSQPFTALATIFRQAQFVVCLENGLSHLAGHTGTPCFTLYRSKLHARPPHTRYINQTPIQGEDGLTVDRVYDVIASSPVSRLGNNVSITVL